MRARWVWDKKSLELPLVAITVIASWWPTRYYLVQTIFVDIASSNDPECVLIRQIAEIAPEDAKDVKDFYVTQVFKCDISGWPKSHDYPLYYKEYPDREQAVRGHKETVELLTKGELRLKKRHISQL